MIRLFRVSLPTSLVALLLSEALLLVSCYIGAAYLLLDVDPQVFLLYDGGLLRIGIVVAVLMLGLYFADLYENYRIRSRVALIQQFCMVLGVAFLAQALVGYGTPALVLPKWLMICGSGLALLLVPAWRVLYSSVVSRALGSRRLLFLGSSAAVQEIIERVVGHPELGWAAIGFVDEGPEVPEEISGVNRLGDLAHVGAIVAESRPDRIVVGMAERRQRLPVHKLLELRFSGIQIEEAANTYERLFGRVSTRDLRPSQLVFSEELGPRPSSVALQAWYSLGLGLIGIVLALPLMALLALLVKVSSPGPALLRQTRVGLNGKVFTVFKFRSMYEDAEARTGAVWAQRDDPRITPIGRWLRRLRLDELPQLLNVIRGEMVLVGPRPERPEFVETLQEKIPFYRQRHCVKPGITGWAQINHKYTDTLEDTIVKLEYDLYYIKNLAPALDAFILFHTLKVMLLSRGAQ